MKKWFTKYTSIITISFILLTIIITMKIILTIIIPSDMILAEIMGNVAT
jgi:hypothetical protein